MTNDDFKRLVLERTGKSIYGLQIDIAVQELISQGGMDSMSMQQQALSNADMFLQTLKQHWEQK